MKKLSGLLCTLLLTACTSMPTPFFGEKVSKLNEGMNKQQVFDVVGKPDTFESLPNGSVVIYLHRQISGWNYQYTDYSLFFDRNNNLIGIRNGAVIDKTANVQDALNNLSNNINQQNNLRIQQNQQIINSLNANRPQKVIICKSNDLGCY